MSKISAMSDNHGSTPAAWTAVIIVTLGFLVGGFAVVWAKPWLFWTSVGIVFFGGLVGWIMRAMGFGQQAAQAHSGGR